MTIKQLIREVEQVTELEIAIKTLMEHTQHYVPVDDLEALYAVIDMAKKLAEYETAEEEGRLVVLPCKVGDKVYIIDDIDYSYERDSVVTGIDIDKYGVSIMIQDESPVSSSGYDISDFGETIFLSKENALKKLKELMQDE